MARGVILVVIAIGIAGCTRTDTSSAGAAQSSAPKTQSVVKLTSQDVQPVIVGMLAQGTTTKTGGLVTQFDSVLKVQSVTIVDQSVDGVNATVIAAADVQNISNEYVANQDRTGTQRMWDPHQSLRLQFNVRLRKYDTRWRE